MSWVVFVMSLALLTPTDLICGHQCSCVGCCSCDYSTLNVRTIVVTENRNPGSIQLYWDGPQTSPDITGTCTVPNPCSIQPYEIIMITYLKLTVVQYRVQYSSTGTGTCMFDV